jgi:transcriptional regulator with XRE-family HTH domain
VPRRRSSNRTFAKRLRQLRHHAGLSQEELASRCGLHRNYVGSVERGERNITFDTADRIADTLHVRLIDMLSEGK